MKESEQSPVKQQSHVSRSQSRTKDGTLQQSSEPHQAANKTAGREGHAPPVVRVQLPSDSSTDAQFTTGVTREFHTSNRIQEEAPERDDRSRFHGRHSRSPVVNSLDIETGWETGSTSSDGSDAPFARPLEGVENSVLDETHIQAVTAQFEAAMFGGSGSSHNAAMSREASNDESMHMGVNSEDVQTPSQDPRSRPSHTNGSTNSERSGGRGEILSKTKSVVQQTGAKSTKMVSSSNRNIQPAGLGTLTTISKKQPNLKVSAASNTQQKKLAARKETQDAQKKLTDRREAQHDPKGSRNVSRSNSRLVG